MFDIIRKYEVRYNIIVTMVLIGVICLLYHRVVFYPFISWDDFEYIIENPVLKTIDIANLQKIFTPGGIPGEMLYIPLTYLSYAIEVQFFSLNPQVVHTTNIILHVLNAILVFYLIRALTNDRRVPLATAIIFSIHPIMVEPVVWAMGRKDLLSTFAVLAALLCYCRYLGSQRKIFFASSAFLFVLSILTKPSMITVPALFLLIDYRFRGKLSGSVICSSIPFWIISLAALWINTSVAPVYHASGPSMPVRILAIPWVVYGWLCRFAGIVRPGPFYCWPPEGGIQPFIIPGLIGIISLIGISGFALKQRSRDLLFALVFLAIAFLPSLGIIVSYREFVVGDRYGYFPLIGACFAVAAGVSKRGVWRIYPVLLSCWAMWLTAMTSQQIEIWSSSKNVWQAAFHACPHVPLVRNNLAMAYRDSGQLQEAIRLFEDGLALAPGYAPFHNNLGRIFFDRGEYAAAANHFDSVLRTDQNNVTAMKNLADTCRELNNLELSITHYRRAVELDPNNVDLLVALGNALHLNENLSQAEFVYRRALTIQPKSVHVCYNLGIINERLGSVDQAIRYYSEAIQGQNDYGNAHFNLANVLSSVGRFAEAAEHLRIVLSLEPENIKALINLGNSYFRMGDMTNAEKCYTLSLGRGTTPAPGIYYNLGLIYAKVGSMQRSIGFFLQAITIDPEFGEAHLELARCYAMLGKNDEARNHRQRAAELGLPVNP